MLNAFDEYPVENFHSLLQAQSHEHDNGDTICRKAKRCFNGLQINICNSNELHTRN